MLTKQQAKSRFRWIVEQYDDIRMKKKPTDNELEWCKWAVKRLAELELSYDLAV